MGVKIGTGTGQADLDDLLRKDVLTTQGDIIIANASGVPTRLAKGTARQSLRMNAGATAPEWAGEVSLEKVLDYELEENAAVFSITPIPTGYRRLVVVALLRSVLDSIDMLGLRFNSDVGANYDRVYQQTVSSVTVNSATNQTVALLGYGISALSHDYSMVKLTINNDLPSMSKLFLFEAFAKSAAGLYHSVGGGRWNNYADEISSFELASQTPTNIKAGSRIMVMGDRG